MGKHGEASDRQPYEHRPLVLDVFRIGRIYSCFIATPINQYSSSDLSSFYVLIQVKVYECPRLAQTCGQCQSLETEFSCGWCVKTRICSSKSLCGLNGWLSRDQFCPDPTILSVSFAAVFFILILKYCFISLLIILEMFESLNLKTYCVNIYELVLSKVDILLNQT